MFYTLLISAVIATGVALGDRAAPWASAWFYRIVMNRAGTAMAAALEPHVPPGVLATEDLRYDRDDSYALLDVFRPAATASRLPVIVWIHGGAWIAGSRKQVDPYLRIIAGNGYTAVSVDYPLAPAHVYPAPVLAANRALGWLMSHADELSIDRTRIFLAGDSAGAQIAAQLAAGIANPSYARSVGFVPSVSRDQLRGIILFCGAYDASRLELTGPFGRFVRTALWAYSGTREFSRDVRMQQSSVPGNVTPAFPPAFVSAGNADPLLPHSRALVNALLRQRVPVDPLFFPDGYTPALGHEYQFSLDNAAGEVALQRMLAFLQRLSANTWP